MQPDRSVQPIAIHQLENTTQTVVNTTQDSTVPTINEDDVVCLVIDGMQSH